MGQVLNCIWVVLSLWMFVHWRTRSSAGNSCRAGLCGLVCLLTLLFPVISANDDLMQCDLWDAPVSPLLKALTKPQVGYENGAALVCGASTEPLLSSPVCAFVAPESTSIVPLLFCSSVSDRSPPSLS